MIYQRELQSASCRVWSFSFLGGRRAGGGGLKNPKIVGIVYPVLLLLGGLYWAMVYSISKEYRKGRDP